jgi:hypothetical protein
MGSGDKVPPFFTAALDGGEWSASRPGRFTHGERAPDTHFFNKWKVKKGKVDPELN